MIFKIIKEKLIRETVTIQVTDRGSPRKLEQPKNRLTPLPWSRSRSEKCDECGTYHITPMMTKVPDYAHNDMDRYGNKKEKWRCNECEDKSMERFMRRMRDFEKYGRFFL